MSHDEERSPGTIAPGALSALLAKLAATPVPTEEWVGLRSGDRVGRFEIRRELGRGGFGVVYEARDTELGRAVAFKALRAGEVTGSREERLLREAEAAARLSHPNIVTLHEVGRFEHGPYLVLELLRGETLGDRLERGALPVREAVRIGLEVAKGLAHAHGMGVIHRDLTPGNVYLCEDGQVKVLDLGMAHAFGRRKVDGGTRAYMAPEQARGAPEDERTDVFALGVVLHQMLSGELPFDSPEELEGAGAAPRLEVKEAPGLGALVGRMLEKDPVQRPRDAGELPAELAKVEGDLARAPSSSGRGVTARRPRLAEFLAELKRRRVIRALVAYAVASFALLQVTERVVHGLHLQESVLTVVVVVLGCGFPAAAALAWVFDRTAGGIERTPAAKAAAPGPGWNLPRGLGREKALEGGAAAHPVPSIAVLPFLDMSPQHDQEYFADGVAEEILNALARVKGLRVVGRTSSFFFKGKNAPLAEIGRQLHVGAVLEGGIRKDDVRFRITAQVLNVADGFHVWSETYDRELTGILAVQEEVARSVARALEVKLVPGVNAAAEDRRTHPQAFDAYLLGRQLENSETPQGFRQAAASYERALELDPGFAPAAARLAIARYEFADMAETSAERDKGRVKALQAAERAVALDPRLATGYAIRAYLRGYESWDWRGAQADAERAVALNPGDAWAHFARAITLGSLGRLPEAISAIRRAAELDPLRPTNWWVLSYMLAAEGRFEEAEAAARRTMEIGPGETHGARNLGLALLLEGRHAEAAVAFERSPFLAFRLLGTALAQHALGHAEASQRALDELIARYAHGLAYQIAQAYSWRGEADNAFEWLDRAYAQHDSGLADYAKYDPLLRPLRGDARYGALLRKMNLPLD